MLSSAMLPRLELVLQTGFGHRKMIIAKFSMTSLHIQQDNQNFGNTSSGFGMSANASSFDS